MGPLTDGDYGNNYSNTIYGNVSPNIVGFGAGNSSDSSSGSSSFGISLDPMSLVSNGFNAVSQLLTNHFNRKFAAQQAKLQNQWNIEQWIRENAYNTPAAQMQRFIQAGLNPNLLVGGHQNLAASSPHLESAKDAPAGVAPQVDPTAALVSAQRDALVSQSRNLEANTALQYKSAEKSDAEIKAIFKGIDLDDAQINVLKGQFEKISHEIDNIDLLSDYYKAQTANWDVKTRADNLRFTLDSELYDTYVKRAMSELSLSEQEADLFTKQSLAQIYNDQALASYFMSMANLNAPRTGAYWRLLRSQGDLGWSQGSYYAANANVVKEYGGREALARIAHYYGSLATDVVNGIVGFIPDVTLDETLDKRTGPEGTTTRKTQKRHVTGKGSGRGRFWSGLIKYLRGAGSRVIKA